MNNKFFYPLTIATASLALGLAVVNANSVQAATITYDVDVSIDSGPLLGDTSTGFFSFDDAALTGSGSEFLSITDLDFSFSGVDYTEVNDLNAGAAFLDGDFLGLDFSAGTPGDDAISFVSGFDTLDQASFTYDVSAGAGIEGVSYTLRPPIDPPNPPNPSASTPEPASIMSILGLGAIAASSLRKGKRQS